MLIYPGIVASVCWVAYNILALIDISKQMMTHFPQCMEPNPNTLAIACPTVLMLLLVKRPIERYSYEIFLSIVPEKKFPLESDSRRQKAEMLGERTFRFIIYVGSVCLLYKILLQEDCYFLSTYIGGTTENPVYYPNYPCISKPRYLDDFYVLKLSYHLYELLYCVIF